MLVVRVSENVRAVQSSYYSSCPCMNIRTCPRTQTNSSFFFFSFVFLILDPIYQRTRGSLWRRPLSVDGFSFCVFSEPVWQRTSSTSSISNTDIGEQNVIFLIELTDAMSERSCFKLLTPPVSLIPNCKKMSEEPGNWYWYQKSVLNPNILVSTFIECGLFATELFVHQWAIFRFI
jgi:hypothetical protein